MIDAAFGEILTTAEKLRWSIANGEKVLGPETRGTNLLLAHKVSQVHYEPLGVVVAIVSWVRTFPPFSSLVSLSDSPLWQNYPFHNMLSPIIAALTSGNAIVVKPSENVVFSSLSYLSAIHSCLTSCGHPYASDLVQLALCLPEGSSYLSGAKGIRHVTFIGSEEVGQKVAVKAAENGIPVTMELGGKDPAVILPDADLDFFADHFMRAAFQAAGQNCIGTSNEPGRGRTYQRLMPGNMTGIERFIVPSSLYDRFLSIMQPRVSSLKQGSILASPSDSHIDVGAMVSDRQFQNLQRLLDDAVGKGARILCGGKRWTSPEFPQGHYWEPTLMVDVTPAMEIAQQEVRISS